MKEVRIYSLMEHRGAPRLWLQDKVPTQANLHPGTSYTIDVITERMCLVLRAANDGKYTVSKKKDRDRTVPVIDLNSEKLLGQFRGLTSVRVIVNEDGVYILPLASEVKKRARLQALFGRLNDQKPILTGSAAHGAGILSHAIHHGLKAAGLSNQLAFAIDIWPEALDHARQVNDAWTPTTIPLCMPLQELMADEWVMGKLPAVQVLEIGIPCTAHSRAGVSKKKLDIPENDESVGNLVASILALIARTNPVTIVFECVTPYLNSASMAILRSQLRDWGYILHETILSSEEWGSLEARERMNVVAMTEGIGFSFPQKPKVEPTQLSSILENVPLDSDAWKEAGYLKLKEMRDKEQSKGFSVPYLTGSETRIPTLRKGYHKGGSCDARVLHPENPSLSRLLTKMEHCLAKGIWLGFIEGISNTFAHELLGQSVCPKGFFETAKRIGVELLRAFHADHQAASSMQHAA